MNCLQQLPTYNNMKTCLIIIFCLFINSVFGDETVRVSVNDGDSVTLHSHITELQSNDVIVWRFNGSRIAKINRLVNASAVYDPNERFTDRLKMNPQTGSLTITNITSQHTGLYELEIIGDIKKSFSFRLSLKVKTVIDGDSVTLHIDVTDEQRNDKIHWKIKYKNFTVAEIITENGRVTEHVHDERFRGRLKLDDQTGSLTITNVKNNKDSGLYEADVTIGSNTHTIHKTFSFPDYRVSERFNTDVTSSTSDTSGLSSSVIAGICVISSLLVVIAALGVGYRFFRGRRMNCQDSNTEEGSKETNVPLRIQDASNSH